MGPVLELISIKDYIKKNDISDSGVRKQIKENKLISIVYNDLTYIVIESYEKGKLKDTIKNLKTTNKTLRDTNKILSDTLNNNKERDLEIKELNSEIRVSSKEQIQLLKDVIGNYNNLLPKP